MNTKVVDFHKHIIADPLICHGQPCVKGTRIPASVILGALAAGTSYKEIIEEYSPVTSEDISACLAFAAELADYTVADLPRH